MDKATHSGHCQVCDRLQKLPGGVLSKHGYQKKYGFFEGTCWGAGSQPIELAKELAEESIVRVTAQIRKLQDEVKEIESAPIGTTAPAYEYNSMLGGYMETAVTVEPGTVGERQFPVIFIVHKDGKKEVATTYNIPGPVNVENVIRHLRNKRITRIRASIAERTGFIRWQTGRVRDWAARPEKLVPVELVKELEDVHT